MQTTAHSTSLIAGSLTIVQMLQLLTALVKETLFQGNINTTMEKRFLCLIVPTKELLPCKPYILAVVVELL